MFVKVRFARGRGDSQQATAGLVMEEADFNQKNVSEISKLFPYSESLKMQFLQVSKPYETWDEAFNHNFSSGKIQKGVEREIRVNP